MSGTSKLFAAALLVALAATSMRAQRADSALIPARPKLDPGVDTNSAQANYEYGMKRIYDSPIESLRAFYWASRIDPSSGDAMYALWTAKLIAMSDSDIISYFKRGSAKRAPGQLALDSLISRAYAINPFLFSSIDGALMRRRIEAAIYLAFPKMPIGEQEQIVSGKMRAAEYQPDIAYAEGHFQKALNAYAFELDLNSDSNRVLPKKTKWKPNAKEKEWIQLMKVASAYWQVDIHAKRARIFYHIHELDSASTEMITAISILQAQDSGAAQLLYMSKAIFDQSLGMIYERDRRPELAREAYGHALQEDLSYYAAHGRLAELGLEQGDTTIALSEMDLAVQLDPKDPALRYRYAEVLVSARRDAEAAQQLIRAIALDPYYGAPHLLLAMMSDVENYTDDAIAEYGSYVALAARSDPQLPRIKARLAKLTSSVASTQPH
ncbi:MAG TPA: tetratricopeptide repeat protein [Gemmatimonadaceae bacterium]|nr:tetratricopeptide repeat protein [Gemmatimonadaceae bacterium]